MPRPSVSAVEGRRAAVGCAGRPHPRVHPARCWWRVLRAAARGGVTGVASPVRSRRRGVGAIAGCAVRARRGARPEPCRPGRPARRMPAGMRPRSGGAAAGCRCRPGRRSRRRRGCRPAASSWLVPCVGRTGGTATVESCRRSSANTTVSRHAGVGPARRRRRWIVAVPVEARQAVRRRAVPVPGAPGPPSHRSVRESTVRAAPLSCAAERGSPVDAPCRTPGPGVLDQLTEQRVADQRCASGRRADRHRSAGVGGAGGSPGRCSGGRRSVHSRRGSLSARRRSPDRRHLRPAACRVAVAWSNQVSSASGTGCTSSIGATRSGSGCARPVTGVPSSGSGGSDQPCSAASAASRRARRAGPGARRSSSRRAPGPAPCGRPESTTDPTTMAGSADRRGRARPLRCRDRAPSAAAGPSTRTGIEDRRRPGEASLRAGAPNSGCAGDAVPARAPAPTWPRLRPGAVRSRAPRSRSHRSAAIAARTAVRAASNRPAASCSSPSMDRQADSSSGTSPSAASWAAGSSAARTVSALSLTAATRATARRSPAS